MLELVVDKTIEGKQFTVFPKAEYDTCRFVNCDFSNADFSKSSFINCEFK